MSYQYNASPEYYAHNEPERSTLSNSTHDTRKSPYVGSEEFYNGRSFNYSKSTSRRRCDPGDRRAALSGFRDDSISSVSSGSIGGIRVRNLSKPRVVYQSQYPFRPTASALEYGNESFYGNPPIQHRQRNLSHDGTKRDKKMNHNQYQQQWDPRYQQGQNFYQYHQDPRQNVSAEQRSHRSRSKSYERKNSNDSSDSYDDLQDNMWVNCFNDHKVAVSTLVCVGCAWFAFC